MTKLLMIARHGAAVFLSAVLGIAMAGVGGAAAGPVSVSTRPPGAINHAEAQAIAKVMQENSDLQTRGSASSASRNRRFRAGSA